MKRYDTAGMVTMSRASSGDWVPHREAAAEIAELRRHVHDLVCLLNFADNRIPEDMQEDYWKDKMEIKEELRRHHEKERGE